MKEKKTKVDRHGKDHASNQRGNGRVYMMNDPVPSELLEKPDDAKKKQKEENEMPSDFWL